MMNFPSQVCHECHRAEWDSCFSLSDFLYPCLVNGGEKKRKKGQRMSLLERLEKLLKIPILKSKDFRETHLV